MTIAFIVAPISYVTRIPSTSLATQVKVRELVLPEMERHGPIEAWIIDDTGFPKKNERLRGRHGTTCLATDRTR